MSDDGISRDWPGQLVTFGVHGHMFRHDQGAKGGKVYDESGKTLIAAFLYIDAGDENTPTGVYVGGTEDGAKLVYVESYDGASEYLVARENYATETMYHAGYRFTWDRDGDTAEAILDSPEDDPYGRATGTVCRKLVGYVVNATGDETEFHALSLDVVAGYLWGWHSARGTFDLPPDPSGSEHR
ncbi:MULTISPECIES: hypothetical protein [unclassified Streptomyces]|uniref:hypothetical protein n=1 Tax=Streptomyces sp. NPDC056835 TaxID=3345956 RepID=UPI00367DFD8F